MKVHSVTIRTRLILMIIALLTIMGGAVSGYFILKNKSMMERVHTDRDEQMRRALASQGKALAANVALSSARAIVVSDFLFLREIIDSTVKSHPDILYGIIMDLDRKALVHSDESLTLTVLNDPAARRAIAMKTAGVHEYARNGIPVIETVCPISVEGKPWGQVRLGVSLASLEKKIAAARVEVAREIKNDLVATSVVVALLMAVAILLGTWAASRIVMPLGQLRDAAQKIQEGNLNSRVNASGGAPEFASLAAGFNLMTDAIQDRDAAIREKIARLDAQMAEQVKAEQEIRQLKSYLDDVIDSMPSILIGVDRDGVITHWNRGANRQFNISADEAVNRKISDLVGELAVRLDKMQGNSVYREERVDGLFPGRAAISDIAIYPLTRMGEKGAVIRIDDVTERVRLEQMMIQSEKMLSVGGLAAGMAHEINNPLGGILQSLQLLMARLTAPTPKNTSTAAETGIAFDGLQKYLVKRKIIQTIERADAAAKRAVGIVSSMLSFSRKSSQKSTPQDITKLLDECVELASNDYDLKKNYDFRKIEIERNYDADTPLVVCDGGMIQQVILNLLKNGAQAMSEKMQSDGYQPKFTFRTLSFNNGVKIEIEDNGPGMSGETKARILEPFFTTKEIGVGTGLGLSVSYFIICEHHKGKMDVSSTLGEGTCFTLWLPLKPQSKSVEEEYAQ